MSATDRQLIDALWDLLAGDDEGRAVEPAAALIEANEERTTRLAERHAVLIRAASRLAGRLSAGGPMATRAEAERRRIADCRAMITRAGECLDAAGITHVFPKAFQHLPDMGHDIDLLVSANVENTARALRAAFELKMVPNTVAHRFAGKCEYEVKGHETSIEIHHARLGHLGEHAPLAADAMRTRVRRTDGDLRAWQLAAPHQLALAVLQRLYGHLCFRVSDVVAGAALLTSADPAATRAIASSAGITKGLDLFAGYVQGGVRKLDIVDGVFQVPKLGVVAPLFGRTFISLAAAGRFGQAFRIAMIPPVAISSRVLGY